MSTSKKILNLTQDYQRQMDQHLLHLRTIEQLHPLVSSPNPDISTLASSIIIKLLTPFNA